MNRLFIIIFSIISIEASGATFYVAPATATPAGNDAAAGDKAHPWATWVKAFTSRSPGDTVFFRGGVYPTPVTNGYGIRKTINGTSDHWLVFLNYPGEEPVLDCNAVAGVSASNQNQGIILSGSYFKVKGLQVRNVWQIFSTAQAIAFSIEGGNHVIIENCKAYNTHGIGFNPGYCDDTYLINCDTWNNCDSLTNQLPGNDGYGFFIEEINNTTRKVYLKNCRAWECGDDGFAVYSTAYAEFEGCWSFHNGKLEGEGNGFKLGWQEIDATNLRRVVKNCLGVYNGARGLDTNEDIDNYASTMEIYNNLFCHNGWRGIWPGISIFNTANSDAQEYRRVFRNNICYGNTGPNISVSINALYTHSNNSWDSPVTASDLDFISVNQTKLDDPRQADGSLPDLDGAFELVKGSDLIDAGIDVGLPYYGKAPDLGYSEYNSGTVVAGIITPATTVLTCNITSISLTATGGGTYSWSDGTTIVGTGATINVSTPGIYTVTVTGTDGSTDTESILINRDTNAPTAAIINNNGTKILNCTSTSISLTATGGGTYSWSNGQAVVGTGATINVSNPGTYTVTVTGANGCTSPASITITQDITAPTAKITNNTGTKVLNCTTASISLTATGGGTYSWSNGQAVVGTGATLNVSNPGTYTVTVTGANGCTSPASITITQDITAPTAKITNNTGTKVLNCTTASINLTATGGGTYSWSNGTAIIGTTATLNVSIPGTYMVTVTGANSCTDAESVIITRDINAPTAAITNNSGTNELKSTTPSISLTATGGRTYSWSDGTVVVGTEANLNISTPGTYTVTVTGANGCTDKESITITQDPLVGSALTVNNGADNEKKLFCYPVPFWDILNIQYEPSENEIVRMIGLYNVTGSLMKAFNDGEYFLSIPVSELPSGIYFIRVMTDKNVVIRKIIK
jgi:hypothetical protein